MNSIAEAGPSAALITLFLHAAQEVEGRMEEAFGQAGLSGARFGVLEQLSKADDPLPLGELAARLSCVRSNMTQLVDRLEAEGLVRRVDHPSDRRCICAELTPAGRERLAEGQERFAEVVAWFEGVLPEARRDALEGIATALRRPA